MRPDPATHGRARIVNWSGWAFLSAGVAVLGYCAWVLIDTITYQVVQAHLFEEQQSIGSNTQAVNHRPASAPATRTPGLGVLEIPRVGISALITDGTDSRTLRRAVGHIRGTALPDEPGNVALAGHRDTFFRPLRNIRKGDEIELTTLRGHYFYRVTSFEVVGPDDVRFLAASTRPVLTLVTCYPFYFVGPAPQRFVVRAERVGGWPASHVVALQSGSHEPITSRLKPL